MRGLVAAGRDPALLQVTHVIVGFSTGLLAALDSGLAPGSVLFVEDQDVARGRAAAASCANATAVAGIWEAPSQDEAGADRLAGLIRRPPALRAVLPGTEYGVVAAAHLAAAWGVAGAGTRAANVLRDKIKLREAAARAGLSQPDWAVASAADAVELFRARFHGECVLKPSDRQGSAGVLLLGPADDAETAWAQTSAVREPKLRASTASARYLVEQRLAGPEVSVEALVTDGDLTFLNVTAKMVWPGRHPVEIGHVVPAPVPVPVTNALAEAMRCLIGAIGYRTGILHAEWILNDGIPYLVECAGRMPGGRISTLIDLAYGGNLLTGLFAVAEGKREPAWRRPRHAAAVRFVTAEPGLVVAVAGIDDAWDVDGIVDVELAVDAGDVVAPLTSASDRIGSVIATADTAQEARLRAGLAADSIRVLTTPVG